MTKQKRETAFQPLFTYPTHINIVYCWITETIQKVRSLETFLITTLIMATNKTTARMQSQKLSESPKNTVRIAPIPEFEGGKFKDEIKSMLQGFEDRLSGRIQALDVKFTGLFKEFQKDLDVLRQGVTQTKGQVNTLTETVGQIEKSLEFQGQSLKENEEKQKKNMEETKGYIDEKIEELNKKLLLLEKQDRKYNLLVYGIPEESDEDVCEKMRELFVNDLQISPHRVDNMYFAHGHRLPTKAKAGPRPIIIRFTSFGDRELVLSNVPKLAGTRRRILSDLPVIMKEERGKLANKAYKIRQDEKLQTRIREQRLTLSLEVRVDSSESWVKRA